MVDPRTKPVVGILSDDQRVLGVANVILEPNRLNFMVGPLRLLSKRIMRFRMTCPPLFDAELPAAERSPQSERLLAGLLKWCPKADTLLLMGVDLTSPVMEAVRIGFANPAAAHVLPIQHGKHQKHYLAVLQPTFKAFLASLGSSKRRDFERTLRRFDGLDHVTQLKVYSSPEESRQFFEDALSISRKTWQYNDRDAGLKDQDYFRTRYRVAAERGWFRGYILYMDGEPVTFREGYLYGDTYFSLQIGYDPAFSRYQVGVVLLLKTIEDLIENCGHVTHLDLGATETEIKRRISTEHFMDGYYYVFPRNAKGRIFSSVLRTVNGLTERLKKIQGRGVPLPKPSEARK